ncbi:c-type cytochrome [Limnohabitans sp.]|uniref:c-type cytochrome n=1 Tax=Limnohabitans sp. TaxID=1907725 RepID=UPI00333EBC1A
MNKLALCWMVGMTVATVPAWASGEGTYKAVCASCHGQAFPKAPQLGNKAQWAPLIREGQVTLTAHGYVGIRGMPAKGGQPDLTLEAFAEAVNHMVNQSGGNWKTPDAKTLQAMQAEVAKRQKSKAAKAGG